MAPQPFIRSAGSKFFPLFLPSSRARVSFTRRDRHRSRQQTTTKEPVLLDEIDVWPQHRIVFPGRRRSRSRRRRSRIVFPEAAKE